MIQVGGQAVIEGVMMKAPKSLAVVVRRPNGEMVTKEDILHPWSDRFPFLKWPVLRGTLILLETLIQGIQALNFSANQAMTEEKESKEIGWRSHVGHFIHGHPVGIGIICRLAPLDQCLSGRSDFLPFRCRCLSPFISWTGGSKFFSLSPISGSSLVSKIFDGSFNIMERNTNRFLPMRPVRN